jgi:hypothetical protein
VATAAATIPFGLLFADVVCCGGEEMGNEGRGCRSEVGVHVGERLGIWGVEGTGGIGPPNTPGIFSPALLAVLKLPLAFSGQIAGGNGRSIWVLSAQFTPGGFSPNSPAVRGISPATSNPLAGGNLPPATSKRTCRR